MFKGITDCCFTEFEKCPCEKYQSSSLQLSNTQTHKERSTYSRGGNAFDMCQMFICIGAARGHETATCVKWYFLQFVTRLAFPLVGKTQKTETLPHPATLTILGSKVSTCFRRAFMVFPVSTMALGKGRAKGNGEMKTFWVRNALKEEENSGQLTRYLKASPSNISQIKHDFKERQLYCPVLL